MISGLLIEACLKPCSHRQRFVSSCLKYASPPLVRPQRIVVARGLVMWTERSGEKSVNARTSKAVESTDGDLSTVIRGCCRLCMYRAQALFPWSVVRRSTSLVGYLLPLGIRQSHRPYDAYAINNSPLELH
ncbi:hypothetical protein AVEN_125208-1 [Araneus ventricosus]|uniref:Uncharacterized protein n=1 Tax=Araneus ventricosus TaxID=182803 RepID=A0A4Y2D6P3_ARAVE|nr:hypothetical protein AVEN_125208-1 [Araneus ventricosus]